MKRFLAGMIGGGVLLGASAARAEFSLGAHVEAGLPIDSYILDPGIGFGGNLGYRIGLGPVFLLPELAGDVNFLEARIIRARAGLRFGFGKLVVPSVYAHLGYGHTRYEVGPTIGFTGEPIPAQTYNRDGLALDAGLALDIRPIKYVSFGARAGYNVTYAGMGEPLEDGPDKPVAKWVNLGAHVSLFF